MKLTHVGVSHFRSIGETPVMIDLTKKINVLVGANNCGKSNVLRAVCSFGSKAETELDRHWRAEGIYPRWELGASPEKGDHPLFEKLNPLKVSWEHLGEGEAYPYDPFANLAVDEIESFWADFIQDKKTISYILGGSQPLLSKDLPEAKQASTEWLWDHLLAALPQRLLIPQFRRITDGDKYSIEGAGVIETLARWQNPKIGEESNAPRFRRLQKLVRELTLESEVTIDVDHDKSMIVVRNGDFSLPLDSYGTGIHELIVLAIAVLSYENALICVEEPEIHLHPQLQRRFLQFLRTETTNRYIIATHSPALIAPSEDTAVTHLWLENGVTQSRRIETTSHSLEALRDLGAKASDLLQANSVIWVEGPSDRIYLKRWLELMYPGEFREGIDYSVMFYGGRLLAHVSLDRHESTVDAEDADDLVHLLRINQHSAILIDSDRKNKNAPLNATKLRVQQECEASKILCWITDGREIENYLSPDAIATTYADAKLAGRKTEFRLRPFDDIESALKKSFGTLWPRAHYYDQSKPQMARRIAKHISKESLGSDLVAWMEKLVRVIRHEVR